MRTRRALTHRRAAALAALGLLTAAAAALLAHEGHAPLPGRGAQADPEKGTLILTAAARANVDVETAPVEARGVDEFVPAYASLVAPWRNRALVSAKLPGRVVRVAVAPGQTVAAGAVLAEVESAEVDALQADVLAARNDIALAEKLVAELNRAADAGAVAGQLAIDAETRLARSKNALELARAKWLGLGLPEARLSALRRGEPAGGLALPVVSPVSGTVARADLTTGKVVDPSEPLVEIIDLSTVWVRVEVLEKDMYRAAVGQTVNLSLGAYPGEAFRTTVRATSQFLDAATNVTVAWAELTNPSGAEPRFRPGMSGQAALLVPRAEGKPRPTVPAAAVLREGAERFVLVEEANAEAASEYRRVPVAVGREAGGRVEVLSAGLFPGDRVVTRGGHELGTFFAPTVLRLSAEAERNIGLRVAPAELVALDAVVALDGSVDVTPARRGFAASQLAGTVQAIRTDRGRLVAAGEVLAEVFSPELLTTQQELLRVHLETGVAADALERMRKAGAGAAPTRIWELDTQVIALKTQSDALRRKLVTAGLTAAQVEQVIADKRLVGAAPVRAPFSGTVGDFDKVLGQAVAAHEALFEVRDVSGQAPVRGLVPERDAARVSPGQPVRVRLVADPGFVATGRVARSGRTFGTDSRTQSVWADLDAGPARPLVHGQLATLTVVVGTRPPALAVPRAAVVAQGSASFVFVRKPDGTFDRRAVETGPADDRFVSVLRGLSAGELVAAGGAHELLTAFASLK